jgi:16S rRNA C1402 (ribose-2'-O) methylase RsmI
MLGKIISQIITILLGKGLALLMGFLQKRKVQKLERLAQTQKDKITILEHERKTEQKIRDWKYRLDNKESASLAKELNRIRNEK